jgi:excisionase family DNA binding protein
MSVDPTEWDEFPVCEWCGDDAYWVDVRQDGSEHFACHGCKAGSREGNLVVSRRRINAQDNPRPLTVAQAAVRENLGTRTIYRWLEDGELGDGAWKAGSKWLIDPAALDRHRVQGPRPRKPRQSTKPVMVKGKRAAATTDDGFPR